MRRFDRGSDLSNSQFISVFFDTAQLGDVADAQSLPLSCILKPSAQSLAFATVSLKIRLRFSKSAIVTNLEQLA